MNDAEMLRACRSGRREAWDLFVDRFSKLIHWSIRRTLANTPYASRTGLADEIFQDVFAGFLAPGRLEALAGAEHLRRFLVVTAAHRALDRVRGLSREEGRLLFPDASAEDPAGVLSWESIPSGQGTADAELLRGERGRVLESALGGLGPKEAFCIRMHYLEGMTHREIAGLLGIPQDTVSTMIRRTREKLKRALEEAGFSEAP